MNGPEVRRDPSTVERQAEPYEPTPFADDRATPELLGGLPARRRIDGLAPVS